MILGKRAPAGKLSFSSPRSMDQLPLHAGDAKYDPLFAVGFGLKYRASIATTRAGQGIVIKYSTAPLAFGLRWSLLSLALRSRYEPALMRLLSLVLAFSLSVSPLAVAQRSTAGLVIVQQFVSSSNVHDRPAFSYVTAFTNALTVTRR